MVQVGNMEARSRNQIQEQVEQMGAGHKEWELEVKTWARHKHMNKHYRGNL